MICPRCTIGEIAEDTGLCVLCGFAPGAAVVVHQPVVDEVLETVQRELEGRFKIRVLLRHGTRSIVYLAEDVASGRLVALKVIPLQRGMQPDLARFEREAALAASLSHSHIASVLDSGATRALLWYSTEHVEGRSLADILRESGPLELDPCRKILEQVASALDYMHRRSVTHGNLKPSNILLDTGNWARISDPCIMGVLDFPSGQRAGKVVSGTPEYMAPEQFRARAVGASADQYALGVIAYECLTGNLPFVGDAPDEFERLHKVEMPVPLAQSIPGIPDHVSEAVQRTLRKTPAERFPSVLDFVALLRRDWIPGATNLIVPEGRPSTPSRVFLMDAPKSAVPRRLIKVGVPAVALVVAALLWHPWSASSPPDDQVMPPVATQPRPVPIVRDRAAEQPPATARETPQQQPTRQTATAREPQAAPATTPQPRQPPLDPGTVLVNTTPWGQVYVDGEMVGNTPKVLSLSPGAHTIRVVQQGFEPFETEVQVASGQQVRLTDIVLKARQP